MDESSHKSPAAPTATAGLIRICLIALLTVTALLFVNSRGSVDTMIWLKWSAKIMEYGPTEGYRQIGADYPPLSSEILGIATWCGAKLGMERVTSIKLSLLIALWVTTGVLWAVTKNYWATVLAYAALMLHSAAHAYLDIYYAPILLGALVAFCKERYSAFSVLYTLTCLVKWQPLILAPFFVLHVLRTQALGPSWRTGLKTIFSRMVIPVASMGLATRFIFGYRSLANALYITFRGAWHRAFSMQALNLPWVVSHCLQAVAPGRFTGWDGQPVSLIGGEGQIMMLPSEGAQLLSRLPFVLAYFFCFRSVWKSPVSANSTLTGCIMGYLSYVMLSTGVHENHLFVAVLLALYLFAISELSLEITACLALIMNGNLIAFDSLEGLGLRFPRALGGVLDVAVCMAAINVLVSGVIVWVLARRLRERSPAASGNTSSPATPGLH